jgi:hypothetical protein
MIEPEELPPDLLRQVEILELFDEHAARTKRRALIATFLDRRSVLDGYAVYRDWQKYGSFLERREAEEQRRLNERVRRVLKRRRGRARNLEREREQSRARTARWRTNCTPEQRAKQRQCELAWHARNRIRRRQAQKLEAWKAKAAMTRAERRAARERERYAERVNPPDKLKCCQCRKQFKPKRSDSMYCAAACKQEAYRKRQAESAKARARRKQR